MPPRKTLGERHPCGKLKQNNENSLPLTVWKRGKEAIANFQLDPRLGTELGKRWLAGDLTETEASAADEVARIYDRYEKLHGKRRSVASPSYGMGRSGSTGLADERMTPGQSKARNKREKSIEAAFMALQDEMASESRDVRDALEQLCVEDRPVPGWLLPEIRKVLQRLARKWRAVDKSDQQAPRSLPIAATIEDSVLPEKELSYDTRLHNLDEMVARAIEIVRPWPPDEHACRSMIVFSMAQVKILKEEVRPGIAAAENDLASRIRRLKQAERAWITLPRIYKRFAFPERDDFDHAMREEFEGLVRLRERLEMLDAKLARNLAAQADEVGGSAKDCRPRKRRPKEPEKEGAAAYAYCILVAWSQKQPTSSVGGPFFHLASVIYEGAMGKEGATGEASSLSHHCRQQLEKRLEIGKGKMPASGRVQYRAMLRDRLRRAALGENAPVLAAAEKTHELT